VAQEGAWAAAVGQAVAGVVAEWEATVPERDRVANAFARNVAPKLRTRPAYPVTTPAVPNAVQRWPEPE